MYIQIHSLRAKLIRACSSVTKHSIYYSYMLEYFKIMQSILRIKHTLLLHAFYLIKRNFE